MIDYLQLLASTNYSCGSDVIIDPPITHTPVFTVEWDATRFEPLVNHALDQHYILALKTQTHWDGKFLRKYGYRGPSIRDIEKPHASMATELPERIEVFNAFLREAVERINAYTEEDLMNHVWGTFPQWFQRHRGHYTNHYALGIYHLKAHERDLRFVQLLEEVNMKQISTHVPIPTGGDIEW